MPDDLKISTTPQIRRLDIVVRISVESLVRQCEFIELMDPQKYGTKLPRVLHEGIECDIFSIRSKTQRVIWAVWRSVQAIRTLPPELARGGDGSGEILHSRTNLVVRRIVGAQRDGARRVEPINPTPEPICRIDFHRSVGLALRSPQPRLTVEISRHHLKRVLRIDLRVFPQELPDLKPQRMIGAVWILRRPKKNHHERLVVVDHRPLRILLQQRPKIFHFPFESGLAVLILEQNILVDATQDRNQPKSCSKLRPCGINVASIVADGLILQSEGGAAVRHIFLNEPFAV